MATETQIPNDPLDLSTPGAARHVDRMLDKAVEDSFPNSDPVALAMPHDRIEDPASRAVQTVAGIRDAWPLAVIGGIIVALLLARRR